jgi:methionyl-tRNA formyltransferase
MRNKLKIVFFGTPDYVLPILKALVKKYGRGETGLVAVVTQPPKAAGRKKFITRSPIDNWAYKHKVPVIYDLTKIPEADLGILAAYGKIIPKEIISGFESGILNVHPSLLPSHRGPSPVQAAIAKGETSTGVSVIKMDEQIDHGPIISQFKEAIQAQDTTGSLRARLFERAAEFLVNLIPAYLEGKITPKEQDDTRATYTKIYTKQDGFLDLNKVKPKEAERFIRAMDPWPGVWTFIHLPPSKPTKRLKILKAHLNKERLILDEVQLEGKNPVSWAQFKEGYSNHEFVDS